MYVSPFIKMTIEEELGHEKEQDAESSQEEQIPLSSGDIELNIQNDAGSDDALESSESDALQAKVVDTGDTMDQCDDSDSPIEKMSVENLESQDESKNKSFDRKCGLIVMLLLAVIIFGAIASLIIIKSGSKQVNRSIFSFATYFGDHMVLQRAPNRAVVWGYSSHSADNTTVQLTLTGEEDLQEHTTDVSAEGVWKFVLRPVVAPGPFSIRVVTGGPDGEMIELKDVLFGDVWLCAGQNNMQQALNKKKVTDADFEDLNDLAGIRLLSLWPDKSSHPKIDISQPEIPWSLPSKESLLGIGGEDVNNGIAFSGLCWLYGTQLHRKLGYPVGLVSAAYSFSSVEDWAAPETLGACNISAAYLTSTVYNALVKPLFTTSLYGIIWYQGDSDAAEWSIHYHCILVEMVRHWRRKWLAHTGGATEPELPFGIVQLGPNEDEQDGKYGYPELRWQQTADYGYVPNPLLRKSFMAVAVDLPPSNSSSERPQNIIAERLLKGSMVEAYQQKGVVFHGPLPTSYVAFEANQSMILYIDAIRLDVREKIGFEVCCALYSNQTCTTSFSKASYALGREWASAPITSYTPTSVLLSWRQQEACVDKVVVGLRYLWSEKPCLKYLKCPVYDGQSGLPMPPYIKLRLQNDGQKHSLTQEQTFLL